MESTKKEYITEEMIQQNINSHKYIDQNGVVHTTNTKYFIKD